MLLHRSTHTLPHAQPVWGSASSARCLMFVFSPRLRAACLQSCVKEIVEPRVWRAEVGCAVPSVTTQDLLHSSDGVTSHLSETYWTAPSAHMPPDHPHKRHSTLPVGGKATLVCLWCPVLPLKAGCWTGHHTVLKLAQNQTRSQGLATILITLHLTCQHELPRPVGIRSAAAPGESPVARPHRLDANHPGSRVLQLGAARSTVTHVLSQSPDLQERQVMTATADRGTSLCLGPHKHEVDMTASAR